MWGSVVSMLSVAVILIGSHLNKLKYPQLPVSTDNCDLDSFNATSRSVNITAPISSSLTTLSPNHHDDVHWLFRISFMYYSLISISIFATVSLVVSYLTRDPNDRSYEDMDQRLFAPFMRDQNLYRKQQFQRNEDSHQLKALITPGAETNTKATEDCVKRDESTNC